MDWQLQGGSQVAGWRLPGREEVPRFVLLRAVLPGLPILCMLSRYNVLAVATDVELALLRTYPMSAIAHPVGNSRHAMAKLRCLLLAQSCDHMAHHTAPHAGGQIIFSQCDT